MILLADTNVLIDLWHVGGLGVLPRIAPTEVLDVVLEECDEAKNPGIHKQIAAAGITTVPTKMDWWWEARSLKNSRLSDVDTLNLYYALQFQRLLLTNEDPLRQKCGQLNVRVHGTLWVVRQAHDLGLASAQELCAWLDILPKKGSRLPAGGVQDLKQYLGC